MSSYPPLKTKIDSFIRIEDDSNFKPKLPDKEKIKNYKSIL